MILFCYSYYYYYYCCYYYHWPSLYTGSNWSLWLSVDTYTMWSLLSFVFWSSIHWLSIISLSNLRAKDMSWLSKSPAQHRVIDIPVVYSFRHEHEKQFQGIQYWYTYWMTIFLLTSKSKSTPIISSIPNVNNIDSVVNTLDETNPKNKQQMAQSDILWVSLSPLFRSYLSPMTRRRSDMSTWPTLTSSPPVSLFPLAARRVFCAPCRDPVEEKDDRKSQTWGCLEHF